MAGWEKLEVDTEVWWGISLKMYAEKI